MQNILLPSEERVWDKYYIDKAYELSNDIPDNSTLWDVLEEEMMKYDNVPALEYMKKEISRESFREEVYTWARTFRAMGVEPDEVVPIYGPFFPGFGAMACALNIIGATSYFLKLAISKEALEQEISESKIAVVYDRMWNNVKDVFDTDCLEKVIVGTATDDMPSPKKEVVSFLSYFQSKKNKSAIPKNKKYIWFDEAKQIADYHTGNVHVPFKKDRSAFITSSSGTTVNGIVKGTVATNESAIAQLKNGYYAKMGYHVGAKSFNNLPLTASTSLMALFLLAEYHGMTVIDEPRIGINKFFPQMMDHEPQVSIMTGSFWIQFFKDLENYIQKTGKVPSLEFFDMPIIGGEGCTPNDLNWMNGLMKMCNAKIGMITGAGSSENFSVVSAHKPNIKLKYPQQKKSVIDVGIPYPGMEVKIVDKNEKELGYNQRGELWTRSKSNMKEYYLKPQLTKKTLTEDGWIKSGDMYDMDENGLLYIYGRMADQLSISNGESIYLFDIANTIRDYDDVKYCVVNNMLTEENDKSLAVHVVFEETTNKTQEEILNNINNQLIEELPEEIDVIGYHVHEDGLPVSPTTAKIDRNQLMTVLDYQKPIENIFMAVSLQPNNGTYSIHHSKQEKNIMKSKKLNK